MPNLQSLSEIAAPFIALISLVIVGMWTKHRGIISDKGQSELTDFVLDISMPALVFVSIAGDTSQEMLLQAPVVILAAVSIILLGYVLARLSAPILGLETRQRLVFELETAFPNTGFLGIPVNALLFGTPGAFFAILCDLGLMLLFFSFSAWILDRSQIRKNWRKMLINPINIAILAGLVPALAGWQIPNLFMDSIRMLGEVTIPLGLLLVGLMAVPITVEREQSRIIGWTAFLRLLVIPAIVFAITRWVQLPHPVGAVIVLEAAMPAFAGGPILAQKHGADHRLAASTTVLTTLMATVTLPLFALLVT
jgi:hypothetical protein